MTRKKIERERERGERKKEKKRRNGRLFLPACLGGVVASFAKRENGTSWFYFFFLLFQERRATLCLSGTLAFCLLCFLSRGIASSSRE